MVNKKQRTPINKTLWILLIIGFAIMEFPGILFWGHRIEPMIFKLPFVYGFTIVMWIYMCAIMFIGYKTNWGKRVDSGKEVK